MRHTFLILFGLFHIVIAKAQNVSDFRFVDTVGLPEGVSHFAYEHISRNSSTDCECWDIELIILKNGQQVNAVAVECLEDYTYYFRIENTCEDDPSGLEEFLSDLNIRVEYEGLELDNFNLIGGERRYFYYGGSLNNLLENSGYPNQFTFDVIIERTTMGFTWGTCQVSLDFDYLSTEGNAYTKVYLDWNSLHHVDHEGGCDPTGVNRTEMACCNSSQQILLRFDNSTSFEQVTEFNGQVCFKTSAALNGGASGGPYGGSVNLSAGFEAEVCFEAKRINGLISKETLRNDYPCEGFSGGCVYFGTQHIYRDVVTETYTISCDGSPDQLIDVKRMPIFTEIFPRCCAVTNVTCADLDPTQFNPQGIMNENITSDCIGRIALNSTYAEPFTIEWSGPNGFNSPEENIEGLEPGIYSYTIMNQCCEELIGTVELCENPIRGEWSYLASIGQYCRWVQCEEELPTLKQTNSVCEYEECITPDEVIPGVENEFCIERDYFQGELLGTRIIESVEVEIEYDENQEKCITRILCQNEVIEKIEEDPEFEDWSYDENHHECVRLVICSSEEFEEIYGDPDLEEEYDGRYHECEIRVDCKGEEIEYETDPYDESGWEWTEFGGCNRTIECTRNGEEIEVEGEEAFDDAGYDENANLCYASVYCDGDYVSGEIKYSSPSKGDWSWNTGSPCVREVYCPYTNETFYEYVDPDLVPTGNDCPNHPENRQFAVYCDGYDMNTTTCLRMTEDRSGVLFNQSASSEVSIYPNPFDHTIHVSNASGIQHYTHFEIRNTSGISMLNGRIKNDRIDAGALTPGIYYLHLTGAEVKSYQKKIIKF